MAENRLDTIPNFVRAETLIGLRRAMLRNNVRLGAFVLYRDIQQIIEGTRSYFIAWYDEPSRDFIRRDLIDEPAE